MTEGTEAVKEAKKFVDKFKPDLTITDVPIKALTQFKELANEEFKAKGSSAHYGFTLKYLLDFYFGFLGKGFERTEAKVNALDEELAELKGNLSEGNEQKTIKTVDGKEKVIRNVGTK